MKKWKKHSWALLTVARTYNSEPARILSCLLVFSLSLSWPLLGNIDSSGACTVPRLFILTGRSQSSKTSPYSLCCSENLQFTSIKFTFFGHLFQRVRGIFVPWQACGGSSNCVGEFWWSGCLAHGIHGQEEVSNRKKPEKKTCPVHPEIQGSCNDLVICSSCSSPNVQ